MEIEFVGILVAIITPALTAVAATAASKAAVKTTLNGTVARVQRIEAAASAHEEKDNARHVEVVDRLARIETKLDR